MKKSKTNLRIKNSGTEHGMTADLDAPPGTQCSDASSSTQSAVESCRRFTLRRGLGFWELTFGGEKAVLKDEKGLAYVAYLLLNGPGEAVHALDMVTRIRAANGRHHGL